MTRSFAYLFNYWQFYSFQVSLMNFIPQEFDNGNETILDSFITHSE